MKRLLTMGRNTHSGKWTPIGVSLPPDVIDECMRLLRGAIQGFDRSASAHSDSFGAVGGRPALPKWSRMRCGYL